jgi:hypothetical protein
VSHSFSLQRQALRIYTLDGVVFIFQQFFGPIPAEIASLRRFPV